MTLFFLERVDTSSTISGLPPFFFFFCLSVAARASASSAGLSCRLSSPAWPSSAAPS